MLLQVDRQELTVNVLAAADKYDLALLRRMCEAELSANVNKENAVEYFLAAYLHEAACLKSFSSKFIIQNFSNIKEKRLFESNPKAMLEIFEMCTKQC